MVKKSAFTLIELVFAIVIIAISVMSLPMMSQVTSSNTEANLVQEAIFAAATELNEALSAHWDENSIEPASINSYARVIDLGSCGNNPLLTTYRQMSGHINQPLHRRCLDNNLTTPSDSSIDANITALEDMAHSSKNVFTNNNINQAGYKDDYNASVSVTRPATFGGASNNHIKRVDINITNATTGTLITSLKAYSANIGEVDYYKRAY
ncbi:type II secretion system protein [Sulfurimonas sp. SAG-AH-194-C21]|nr:type II secretion system protein [Sulfurimonas sp. SAG-AH-194-C21]MDF1883216.1 type II secretion system protein [Sulfurimonas sp. SAG-AH-194-C21]